MPSKTPVTRALSRVVIVAVCGAFAIGVVPTWAAESAPAATVRPCLTCFTADTKATAPDARQRDPLGPILCKRGMDSSPPLRPLCGEYR